ncbi:hypothetical protein IJT93_04050 [bacterium]|nr:hypothetical protein [bacterium]
MGFSKERGKNYEEILNEAVYLQTPVLKDENEGKTVIAGGNIAITETAVDKQYNRRFKSISVERHLEHLEKLKGRRNTKYWSTVPGSSELFVGKANLGEFELDSSIIAKMPKKSESVHKLSSKRKLVYKLADSDREMTFVGVQSEGQLIADDDSNLETVYEGRLTKEQVLERERQLSNDDKKVYIMILIITTVVEVFLYTMFMCVILYFFKFDDKELKIGRAVYKKQ